MQSGNKVREAGTAPVYGRWRLTRRSRQIQTLQQDALAK